MAQPDGLRVGHIPYLNCVPWFHYLPENGCAGNLISGVPSALNRWLKEGRLDVSPSSSFEYAQHWQDYLLLPSFSISSSGPIKSVLLFSPQELSELAGRQIAITGESATSINLLRLLLKEFVQLDDTSDAVPDNPVEDVIEQKQPALLIGDRALKLAAKKPAGMQVFDLGELWYQYTGLPFVFALWMIRKDALELHQQALSELPRQLECSYAQVMAEPLVVAEKFTAKTGLSAQQIVAYWQSIDFRLDNQHIKGVQLFFKLCVKHNLLAAEPPLDFFRQS
jgi:chorismate dehydratase